MRRLSSTLLVVVGGCALSACASAPAIDLAAEESEIRSLNERWGPAVARKDTNGVVELYTSDAVLLWPDMPPVRGAEAIRSVWAAAVNTPGLGLRVLPERVRISGAGDYASDEGSIESTRTGPAGTQVDTTKYLHIWTKTDGQWKVLYSMSNSNRPTPPAAAPK
jgi:uncharacterized protein (TIGR02246 family)